MRLIDYFDRGADLYPERHCLHDGTRGWTYAQYYEVVSVPSGGTCFVNGFTVTTRDGVRLGDALLFQGNPVAREIDFRSSCDIAKRYLVQNSVSYDNVEGPAGSKAVVKVGDKSIEAPDGTVVNQKFDAATVAAIAEFKKHVTDDLRAAGYPAKADPALMNWPLRSPSSPGSSPSRR